MVRRDGEQRQQQRQPGTRVGHKRARDDEREGGCRVGAGVGGGSGVRGEAGSEGRDGSVSGDGGGCGDASH